MACRAVPLQQQSFLSLVTCWPLQYSTGWVKQRFSIHHTVAIVQDKMKVFTKINNIQMQFYRSALPSQISPCKMISPWRVWWDQTAHVGRMWENLTFFACELPLMLSLLSDCRLLGRTVERRHLWVDLAGVMASRKAPGLILKYCTSFKSV